MAGALLLGLAAMAVVLILSGRAQAIDGGTLPRDDAVSRATVLVGGVCSGTLVAPDLVLSAGHCFRSLESPPSPALHPAFNAGRRGWNDWQRPDRWYQATNRNRTVTVGVAPGRTQYEDSFQSYAKAGNSDMILLRLVRPVPASAALPIPIMTSLPSSFEGTGDSWVRGRNFVVAGFGANSSGSVDGRLREARVRGAAFPCPRGRDGWVFGGDHKLCARRVDGQVLPGDSGGPLYWSGPDGRRQLVGITQGIEGNMGGRFTATFYRGGANFLNTSSQPLPNIGSWLERYVNGDVGNIAFLRVRGSRPAMSYPSTTHAWSPGGLDPAVIAFGPGPARAEFPGLRSSVPGLERVLSVTAWGRNAQYCKISSAVGDGATIGCFDTDGSGVPTPEFSVLSLDPTVEDGAIVSIDEAGAASVASASPFSVSRTRVGDYRLVRASSPRRPWKYASATAVGTDSTRCNVVRWWETVARVRCVSPDGTPTDSGFHFTTTGSSGGSYAWSPNATRPSGPALAGSSQVADSRERPQITRHGEGYYSALFPGLPRTQAGNVQVSVHGATSNHCKTSSWGPDRAWVRCFDSDGSPADARFTVRYVDPLDNGAFLQVRLLSLRSENRDACGDPLDLRGGMRFTSDVSTPGSPLVRAASIPLRANRNLRRFEREGRVPTIAAFTKPGQRFVEVLVAVDHANTSGCGSRFPVDIVPGPSQRDLRLRIDLHRHRAEVLDPSPSIQSGLGRLGVGGRHGSAQAHLELSVEVIRGAGGR